MFEITRLMSLDISIFIIIIGVIFLYFGGIIGSTKVEKYDKLGYYSEGLIFFAVYIYIPTLFAYYIYSKNLFTISSSVSIGIQVVILIFLSWNLNANQIKTYELLDEIKKIVEERTNKINEHFGLSIDYTKYIDLIYYKIPIKIFANKVILMFFSVLTIALNIQLYEYGELLILGSSLLLAFFIFTMIALAHGFGNAYHPPGKIYMVDGNIIEGKILKFGEYVHLLKDDKKIFINQHKINFVEESKFKIKR